MVQVSALILFRGTIMTEQTAERPKKGRRFLKWIVIALLLSPIWYVAAWLAAVFGDHEGYLPHPLGNLSSIPFRPLIAYCDSDNYGAETLTRLYCMADRRAITRYPLPPRGPFADSFSAKLGPLSPNIRESMLREYHDEYSKRRNKR